MKITIFGSGYVGLVTGACLAEVGNHVVCVDIDQNKVDRLNQGEIPIYEPGLDSIIHSTMASGHLSFTTDVAAGVEHGVFQFIAVGTPPDEDGSADLQHVQAVATSIGEHINDYRLVITKSTVPVGTAEKVRTALKAAQDKRGVDVDFDVASNPEFLKEGAAVGDFRRPDRIVVGADSDKAADLFRELYAPFNRNHDRLLIMDIPSAELTKYAANAMLATKISFMNELSNIAERAGADIENVRIGIGSDPRIGFHFIYPGCGYGGSCFPKDVRALAHTAKELGHLPEILNAVESVNDNQKQVIYDKIHHHFKGDLKGKTFAVWGLAFKPNTDDMREASSITLMRALWEQGATVKAYDPVAMESAERIHGKRDDFIEADDPMTALEGADALIIMTEWNLFRSPDFDAIASALNSPVVFDGRNMFEPEHMAERGFQYYAIGRGISRY